MLEYILSFEAAECRLAVYRNDEDAFVVELNDRTVAECSEFGDALCVFSNHRGVLEARVSKAMECPYGTSV